MKKIERVRSFWKKKKKQIEADRRKKKEWGADRKKIEADRRKKKKRVERPQRAGERWRKKEGGASGISESKGKKRRGCTNMGIRVWLTKCKWKKKKKKRKRMDERNEKNKKSQFRNTITIFSQ